LNHPLPKGRNSSISNDLRCCNISWCRVPALLAQVSLQKTVPSCQNAVRILDTAARCTQVASQCKQKYLAIKSRNHTNEVREGGLD
jgi:hypothetical protein